MDLLEKHLFTPIMGEYGAKAVRFAIPKFLMTLGGVYYLYYYALYNKKTWESEKYWDIHNFGGIHYPESGNKLFINEKRAYDLKHCDRNEDTTQKDIELDDYDSGNNGEQECPKRFSQPKLNDLTRDLRLSKQDEELLASRLKEFSQLEDDVNNSTNTVLKIGVYLSIVPCVASNVFYFIMHDQLIANHQRVRGRISTNEKPRELMTMISEKRSIFYPIQVCSFFPCGKPPFDQDCAINHKSNQIHPTTQFTRNKQQSDSKSTGFYTTQTDPDRSDTIKTQYHIESTGYTRIRQKVDKEVLVSSLGRRNHSLILEGRLLMMSSPETPEMVNASDRSALDCDCLEDARDGVLLIVTALETPQKHDQLIANHQRARGRISTNEKPRELMTMISEKKSIFYPIHVCSFFPCGNPPFDQDFAINHQSIQIHPTTQFTRNKQKSDSNSTGFYTTQTDPDRSDTITNQYHIESTGYTRIRQKVDKHDQLIANHQRARGRISTNEKPRELMTMISEKKSIFYPIHVCSFFPCGNPPFDQDFAINHQSIQIHPTTQFTRNKQKSDSNSTGFYTTQTDPDIKLQILREIEVEKKKKTDVAQKHNIPQSSLSSIIKNSEKIHQQALHAGESSRKRARGSTYADVDEALLQWFKQARSAALPGNGPLLSEKAKTLALEFGLKDFTGSGGWIERWKARHGIKLRNICGESADVNRETMTNWLTDVMPNIISNYACKDIFNADETGLFWRLLPDKTLHFKGETCTGGKASKEPITILLCCNMDGSENMQPLVIGKAKQPRCFRGIKHLPVQYEANQKAWMTGLLFESWVRHIDKKMAGQHRQIILLLDNCGAHPPDMQGLTNTRIAFLPPNTTSMLQPCDQGIIRNFKMIYRTRLMRKYLTAYDAGTALTINLKQAVDIISVAWNDVLPATISNCWHHSGIIKSDEISPLDTPQPETQMWEQQSLFDRMKELLKIPLEMDFDSYADADNDVVTNAMLSDVEIVESILQAKEEEETDQVDEEVDPIVHIPHPKEVLESIQTLRLFLQCQDESKSLHRHLSDLDNIEKSVQHLLLTSKCQKKITNYFSKNT
ncbi:TIGD4 [Cordylochernes scorpioides]|uniref:TIGD4 n=1 Tax=Cordylochernes scorpioides TaxID=51811 RepID=A0ABY6KDR0_9ARAC|nr:TIGD4 [Cordylochernes scorpioides]